MEHIIEQELPKEITENGIRYILDEATQTYLPDFEETEEEPEIGKYGREREKFLKENRKSVYSMMILQNTLTDHLIETDNKAWKMIEKVVASMAAQDGTDEALKMQDPLKWVGLMNNYKAAAEEIVRKELICA